jgi:hypothetical protein
MDPMGLHWRPNLSGRLRDLCFITQKIRAQPPNEVRPYSFIEKPQNGYKNNGSEKD